MSETRATSAVGIRTARQRLHRRARTVTAVAAALAVVLMVIGLCIGTPTLNPVNAARNVLGLGDDVFVVQRLRLPRVLLGAMVGAVFGLSGALLQTVARNPLASPDLLGITGGASIGAVTAVLLLDLEGPVVSLLAFVGALAAAAAILLLAWRRGVSGYRFVLVGVGIAFMAQGVINYLISRAQVQDAQGALAWLVGSLAGARTDDLLWTAVGLVVLVPLTAALVPRLRMLQLGDDTARALGVGADRTRLVAVLVAVGFAAVGTAAAGPVAFVAFVAAPIARRLVGGGALALGPSALIGTVVVLAADLAGQYLLPGVRVPVGLVTAAVGAPYLLWLLATSNRQGRGA